MKAFEAFDRDSSASVAVFGAEGGAFCVGWDLKYAATLTDRARSKTEIVAGR